MWSDLFSESCNMNAWTVWDAAVMMIFCLCTVVAWYRGEGQLLSAMPGVTFLNDGRILQIERISTSDAGEYVCVASNEAGNTELRYSLEVHGEHLNYSVWQSFNGWLLYINCNLLPMIYFTFSTSDSLTSSMPFLFVNPSATQNCINDRTCHVPGE